jgi:hypothetical protein
MSDKLFDVGDLVFSRYRKLNGMVYDHAYDLSPDRQMFYGVLWADGSRSWESFPNLSSPTS